MRAGRDLRTIATQLKEELTTKKDYVASTSSLTMMPNGLLELRGVGEYSPTNYTLNQIADNIEMPRSYINRLIEAKATDLMADNVNYWLKKEPQTRMIRTVGTNARAYLSDRYRTLDNWDLMSAILPTFEEKGLELKSSELTDTKLYLKATLPTMRQEVKVGQVVEAGICVSNSEIGAGSVKVQPLVFVLSCMNGAIMNTSIRKYHVGRNSYDLTDGIQHLLTNETKDANDKAFWMSVRDVVSSTFQADVFTGMVDKMREAADVPIKGNIEKVVEVTRKIYGLNEQVGASILENLIRGGDLSKWGLSNAVTFIANTAETYELATQLETVGGSILEMERKDWARIAEAV